MKIFVIYILFFLLIGISKISYGNQLISEKVVDRLTGKTEVEYSLH